jgi:CMP-N,N'-diacetyllegionaminic acid synthase
MNEPIENILALIPARGGSKGLLRKNIRPCGGRPLIVHSIVAALAVRPSIKRVMVSTDDAEIADVARGVGAEVPFVRPAPLASDTTRSLEVVLHALDWLSAEEDWLPDWVLLLQPTSPLRNHKDIEATLFAAANSTCDSVVSVTEVDKHHPFVVKRIKDGILQPFLSDAPAPTRRQDYEPVYALNGAIYLTRTAVIHEQNSLYGAVCRPYLMPPERSLDVDTAFDLKVASLLLSDQPVGN